MSREVHRALGWSAAILAFGLLVPSLVIVALEVFVAHHSVQVALAEVLRRQFAEGENLFLVAMLGLFPFLVLSLVCVATAERMEPARHAAIVIGGLIGILLVVGSGRGAGGDSIYRGSHAPSTAVIAFLFIPIYSTGAMLIGILAGYGAATLPGLLRE